jgi:hypothetical protein
VGRRAGSSGGAQYDGWAGELTNVLSSVYFVAVNNEAEVPATPTINIRTNLNASNNGPSVPPVRNGVAYGTLAPGTAPGVSQQATANTVDSVRWSTFTIDAGVCDQSGSLALDFTTLSDAIADVVAWVFDASGDIVAFGDDGDGSPANKPDIRFGVGGNSGHLAAGTYYIATALADPRNRDLSGVPGSDRFHVRGRSGSSLQVGASISFSPGDCPGTPACDGVDFNNDGSFFDPVDIEAFFSVFSEGPCIPATATCNDIDFNNDGSLFDTCDLDSFLLQFSQGPCTQCGQ